MLNQVTLQWQIFVKTETNILARNKAFYSNCMNASWTLLSKNVHTFWKMNWLHTLLLHTCWNQPIKIKLQDRPSIIPCTEAWLISVCYQISRKISVSPFEKWRRIKTKRIRRRVVTGAPLLRVKRKSNGCKVSQAVSPPPSVILVYRNDKILLTV